MYLAVLGVDEVLEVAGGSERKLRQELDDQIVADRRDVIVGAVGEDLKTETAADVSNRSR